MKLERFYILLILIVSFFYTRPFFHQGFFVTHDGEWAVVRLAEMVRELKDLQIPPQWSDYLNHGYGYPLFLFTYPFPFYFGSFLKFIGFGYVDSVKLLFIASVFLSGIAIYFLGKKVSGSIGGLIASLFYITAPYRLSNLYIRGSLGESLSLVLFPVLFLVSISDIEKTALFKRIALSLTLAVLILTHNATALFFFPVWIGFYLLYANKIKKRTGNMVLKQFIPTILLGLGLSAYFVLPVLFEQKYIVLSLIKLTEVSQYAIRLNQLLLPPQSGIWQPNFYLGFFQILAYLLSVVFIWKIQKLNSWKGVMKYIFSVCIIYGLFTLQVADAVWNLSFFNWLDFPWRVTNIILFLLAFGSSFLSISKAGKIIGTILVLFTVIFNIRFIPPFVYNNKGDDYYLTNDATTTSADELMPVGVTQKPSNRYAQKAEVLKGDSAIKNVYYNSKKIYFEISAHTPSKIQTNIIYFPGWKVFVDNKQSSIDYSNPLGAITIDIEKGNHTVEGKFTPTPIRQGANIITILSIVYIGSNFIFRGKSKTDK